MISRSKYAAILAASIYGFTPAGAQEQLQTPEEAELQLDKLAEEARQKFATMTFEEFMATVYREPGPDGKFIVSGDIPIANEKQLREFFEQNVKKKPPESPDQELSVITVGGLDALWTESEKKNLTYCVSDSFGQRHTAVVAAMADAAGAWEAVANVDLRHLTGEDARCDASNAAVVFDVRPVNFGQYLARAFFPPDVRPDRNVLIDESSFELDPNEPLTLTGILRHELGHVLGFRHEHTRPESGTCFEDTDWRGVTHYDAFSTMHYPQCNGMGDWSLRLTDFDMNGAACVYAAAQGFTIDTTICKPEGGSGKYETFENQKVAEGEELQFGPFNVASENPFVAEIKGTGDPVGDPDLYLKFDAPALQSNYDCRPYSDGADEVCSVDVPADKGQAFIMVHGYKPGTFNLNVTYTAAN
ncbi:matrixin family metalloprotease [Mesorhizobium sp. f-mel]